MSTVVPPPPDAPGRPTGRSPLLGGFAVGLMLTLALVFSVRSGVLPDPVADGLPGSSATDEEDEDVLFTDPVRLQQALDAAVDEVGSDRAVQVVVEDREFSAVLLDPDTGLWTRYREYSFDAAGAGYADPLPTQPLPQAEFPLATVSGAGLVAALGTGNRAVGNDLEELSYLQLVAERPFPDYGDVLLAVSDRYSSGSRAWLSPDGTVLRSEIG